MKRVYKEGKGWSVVSQTVVSRAHGPSQSSDTPRNFLLEEFRNNLRKWMLWFIFPQHGGDLEKGRWRSWDALAPLQASLAQALGDS